MSMTPNAITALKITGSVAVIAGALAYLLTTSMSEQMEFFHPADVVIVKAEEMKGQKMRMGGEVVKGSIAQKRGTLDYLFEVKPIAGMLTHAEAANKTITVRYSGIVPDTFKDDAQVVVTGMLGTDGTFHAKDMTAKCPSKYEAQEKAEGRYN
jgi:cytochrome c-type biogenesis protein CcmE